MATVTASVKVHDEVRDVPPGEESWCLCFQRCTYKYSDNNTQEGYRFIWRRPDGTLQAARGQARIIDAAQLQRLTDAAMAAGWFR
jgi:hypothetical protein